MNKPKLNGNSNGYKEIGAIKKPAAGSKIERTNNGKAEKAASESDQLTLRAWKKTFENRNKAA